jgi:hypothetical protein
MRKLVIVVVALLVGCFNEYRRPDGVVVREFNVAATTLAVVWVVVVGVALGMAAANPIDTRGGGPGPGCIFVCM